MDRSDLRVFVDRDWHQKEALKQSYWVERYRVDGARATLDASNALYAHLEALRPDWPTR